MVHIDDLLEGWDGLPGVTSQFDAFLLPLSRREAGSYRRYDWHAGAFAETVPVPVTPLLVVEGVGCGSLSHALWHTVLVWVEADDELRLARGLARDGEALRPQWEQWMREEVGHFTANGPAEAADLVSTSGQAARSPAHGPGGAPRARCRPSPGCPSPGRCCRREVQGRHGAPGWAGPPRPVPLVLVAPVAVDHGRRSGVATTRDRASANHVGRQQPNKIAARRWKGVTDLGSRRRTRTRARRDDQQGTAGHGTAGQAAEGRQVCGDHRAPGCRVGRHGCR